LSSENLRSRLGAFLFSGDDVFKKVGDLSGGERSRLALCKLVLAEPEVLVLDEPTNHLDIPSTEALENALQNYKGTIIAVSHDRFFLDKVVNKLLVLGTDEFGKKAVGRFELIEGPFSRYAELLEERAGSQNEKEKGSKAAKPKRPKRQKQKKTTPPELRQFNGWSIERIEDAIFETEEQLESLHERFGDEKTYKTPRLLAELQKEFEEKQQHLNLLYQAHEWRTS
jgi:ATP-binding cassette subfamily F protein 3